MKHLEFPSCCQDSNKSLARSFFKIQGYIQQTKGNLSSLPITVFHTLNSVYNDIPAIAIEFHGPGHDASI